MFSSFSREGEKEVVNDIFVFDPSDQALLMMILGAHSTKVSTTSLTKVLSSVNSSQVAFTRRSPVLPITQVVNSPRNEHIPKSPSPVVITEQAKTDPLDDAVLQLLNKVADVPINESSKEAPFKELGIDSLMVNEVLSEIRLVFGVDIPLADFQGLQDCVSLSEYIHGRRKYGLDVGSSGSSASDSALILSSASSVSLDGLPSAAEVEEDSSLAITARLVQLIVGHLEIPETRLTQETCLSDEGMDSLLTMELVSDIEEDFQVQLNVSDLTPQTSFGDVCGMVISGKKLPTKVMKTQRRLPSSANLPYLSTTVEKTSPSLGYTMGGTDSNMQSHDNLAHAHQTFNEQIRHGYDDFAKATGFANFWADVYPTETRLVVAYVVEAFEYLRCSLHSLRPGQRISIKRALPKHRQVILQLFKILEDADLTADDDGELVRSHTLIERVPAKILHEELLRQDPQYSSEHQLLQITGSQLGACLSGDADPLQLLFRSKATKELLEDFYTNAPLFASGTMLLGKFLSEVFSSKSSGDPVRILELGGGTGGTTRYIVDHLVKMKIHFKYTFTDISSSLVASARKKFAAYDFMDFKVLDIENTPPEQIFGLYHAVLSTNCIHATRNLTNSLTNVRKTLRPDGFVSLVELTRNIPWFDLVFGLLEGWWLFNDGRTHALADVPFWEKSMKAAGFERVVWTEGTPEAGTLRIVAAFQPGMNGFKAKSTSRSKKPLVQTVTYKQVDSSSLPADIYYPSESQISNSKRPIGMQGSR